MAPNGMMQVWSGLLLRVDNEAQLVAVLAHEVGHYLQRHTLEQLQNLRSRAGFGVFLSLFGVVGLIGQLANAAGAMAFSRDHERDADRIGLRLMLEHGYEGRESARVWSNLLEELQSTPGADPRQNSVLFATHPPSEERRDTLMRLSEAQVAGSGKLGDKTLSDILRPLRGQLLEDEIKRGRPFESVALISRLLSREPGSAELLHYRGEAYLKRGIDNDTDLAFADLKAAEQTGQALPLTHRSLGYLHRQRLDHANARAAWRAYLERAPQAPDAELIRQNLQEMPS
jgi:predicted Zn-dependent protease